MNWTRAAVFLVIASTVFGSLHYYVWSRLVRAPQLPAPWSAVATWTLAVMCVVMIAGMASSFVLPRGSAAPVAWVAYTWMGLAFLLVAAVAASDVGRLVLALARRALADEPMDPARRLFLRRGIAMLVAAVALSLGVAGAVDVAGRVRVKKIRVPIARLKKSKNGYRIAQLTDVHIGPTLGAAWLEEVVAQTNALEPDLIVITGDLVDGRVHTLGEQVRPLAKLRAKDGVYFVTGNHEYYSGVDEWLAFLPSLGVKVLRNERVSIGGDDGFDLAGVDDWTAASFGHGHGADLPRALEGRDESRALVLLAHQPKQVVEASARGVDLMLSGHTHGGQMFPFSLLVKLAQPYVSGLHTHGATAIYVSEGTGYWGPPMRVGTRSEITHIELASV